MVGARPDDGFVVARSCPGELLIVEIQVRQFFVVPDRRVFQDDGFELTDPLAPPERVERLPEQVQVWHHLHEDVDECADGTEKDDHPEPNRVRAAANEMDDRQRLQDDAPGIEERDKSQRRQDI